MHDRASSEARKDGRFSRLLSGVEYTFSPWSKNQARDGVGLGSPVVFSLTIGFIFHAGLVASAMFTRKGQRAVGHVA